MTGARWMEGQGNRGNEEDEGRRMNDRRIKRVVTSTLLYLSLSVSPSQGLLSWAMKRVLVFPFPSLQFVNEDGNPRCRSIGALGADSAFHLLHSVLLARQLPVSDLITRTTPALGVPILCPTISSTSQNSIVYLARSEERQGVPHRKIRSCMFHERGVVWSWTRGGCGPDTLASQGLSV